MITVTIRDEAEDGFNYEQFFFDLWEFTILDLEDDPRADVFSLPPVDGFVDDFALFDNATDNSFTLNGDIGFDGQFITGGTVSLIFLSGPDQITGIGEAKAVFSFDSVDALQFTAAYDNAVFMDDRTFLDQLFTQPGELTGSINDDVLPGFAGDDVMVGGEGDDTLLGRLGDDVLLGGAGIDALDGGEGVDTVSFEGEGGGAGAVVNLNIGLMRDTFGDADLFASIENLTGSANNDRLFGDAGDNRILGDAGDDAVNAKDGDDVLDGGLGDDRLVGGGGDDDITGGLGDDVIGGRTGDDVIDGGDGADVIVGQLGDDDISGGGGDDRINGGVGDDVIDGGGGNDQIFGRAGNDVIDGGDGDDVINGGAESDRLNGGIGDDTLIGGAGADVFVFEPNFGIGGDDRIIGFQSGEDQIQVSPFLTASFEFLTLEQVSGDVVVTFVDNSTVTLVDRSLDQVAETDFLFE